MPARLRGFTGQFARPECVEQYHRIAAVQDFPGETDWRAAPVEPCRLAIRMREHDKVSQSVALRRNHQHGQPVSFACPADCKRRDHIVSYIPDFTSFNEHVTLGKTDL